MLIHRAEQFNPGTRATDTDLVSKVDIGGNYKVTDLAVDGPFFPLGPRVAAANGREVVAEAKCRIDQITRAKRRNRWRT
jgi:hypothetical protein